MANHEKGELELRAGADVYTMRLTTNGICEMESASGRTFGQILARVGESWADARLFVWAMLREKHPKLSLEDCGRIIDRAGGLKIVGKKLGELIAINMAEGDSENPPSPGVLVGSGGNSISTPGE